VLTMLSDLGPAGRRQELAPLELSNAGVRHMRVRRSGCATMPS
jgi:hypothetical protein